MKIENKILLTEDEIKSLRKIASISCNGIACFNCPLLLSGNNCTRNAARRTLDKLGITYE